MLESGPIIRLDRLVISHSACILTVLSASRLPSQWDTGSSRSICRTGNAPNSASGPKQERKDLKSYIFILKTSVSESDLSRPLQDIFIGYFFETKAFLSIFSFFFLK